MAPLLEEQDHHWLWYTPRKLKETTSAVTTTEQIYINNFQIKYVVLNLEIVNVDLFSCGLYVMFVMSSEWYLLSGTMGHEIAPAQLERYQGSLYSIDASHTVKKHVDKIDISNGLAWSLDSTVLYYIDSLPRKIYAFDFDLSAGSLCEMCYYVLFVLDHKKFNV